MKKITLVLLVSLFVLLIASCKSEIEIPQKKYHTITFNTNGESSLENIKIESGALIEKLLAPTKDGHLFREWRTEDDLAFNPSTPITEDITLHAHYYYEAPDDIEKEMYSLFLLMCHLDDWDDEQDKLVDIFGNSGLLKMAYAINGINDGFFSEIYLIHDEKQYGLDLENYSIVEKSVPKLSGKIADEGSFDLLFDDIVYSVELEGVGAIASVNFKAEYNGNETKRNITMKTEEREYPTLSLTTSSDGYLFIYGDYFYSHTHSFGEWTESYSSTEETDGKEVRSCSCGIEEERVIPRTNARSIKVTEQCEKTYDGKPIDISQAITFKGEGVPTFEYKTIDEEDDMYSPLSPKNAGEYTIRITVEPSGEYKIKSQIEVNYTINKVQLSFDNNLLSERKIYNGEKQVWEVSVGSVNDEGTTFINDAIVSGERVIVRFTSNSADAGNYYAYYNYQEKESDGKIEIIEGEGTLLANYSFYVNHLASISKRSLEGNIKIEKVYDRSYNFETTDLSSLTGVVEKDKGRLKLTVLGSYNEVGDSHPQVIKNYDLLLDDKVANNYSIAKSQIKIEIKPREVTLLTLGDTIITPYIEGVNERKFLLSPSDGVIFWTESVPEGTRYYSDNAALTITPNKDLSICSSIDNNDFELSINNKNYTIKKENAPKKIEVVEVTKSIEEYRDKTFSIAPGEYLLFYVDTEDNKGKSIEIKGDEKNKVYPYSVSSSGGHSYPDYQHYIVCSSKSGRNYIFFYSAEGAKDIKVEIGDINVFS